MMSTLTVGIQRLIYRIWNGVPRWGKMRSCIFWNFKNAQVSLEFLTPKFSTHVAYGTVVLQSSTRAFALTNQIIWLPLSSFDPASPVSAHIFRGVLPVDFMLLLTGRCKRRESVPDPVAQCQAQFVRFAVRVLLVSRSLLNKGAAQ